MARSFLIYESLQPSPRDELALLGLLMGWPLLPAFLVFHLVGGLLSGVGGGLIALYPGLFRSPLKEEPQQSLEKGSTSLS